MTLMDSCGASQTACSNRNILECFVVGSDGHDIPGGEVSFLFAVERSAGAAPIKLMLDHCSFKEIELNR